MIDKLCPRINEVISQLLLYDAVFFLSFIYVPRGCHAFIAFVLFSTSPLHFPISSCFWFICRMI